MPACLICSTDDSTEPQGQARGLPAALWQLPPISTRTHGRDDRSRLLESDNKKNV